MKIFSSLGKKKEEFKPLKNNNVTMYACGITPYSPSHLGHGVAAIRFNMCRQYLKHKGYDVTFVQNVTNVDDKLIAKGQETGLSPIEIGDKHTLEYNELLKEMGLEEPDHSPDVISYIDKIIDYIEGLIDRGYAYSTTEGNVYFNVRKKENYGQLSGRCFDNLHTAERISEREDKDDPLDFALWKKDDHPEMSWASPWGQGRPGWHIECSVMSNSLLGKTIDIHCGGLDLIFPHHENEIAQCEAHNGCEFARFWIHSGLLNIDGQKMSKSLGNFFTLREAVNKYTAELIKFVTLKHHYRSDINFSAEIFEDSLNQALKIYRAFEIIPESKKDIDFTKPDLNTLRVKFEHEMDDDFNTAQAIVILCNHIDHALNTYEEFPEEAQEILSAVRFLFSALGLFNTHSDNKGMINSWLNLHAETIGCTSLNTAEIDKKIQKRDEAKKSKDFSRADQIRDELHDHGIKLLDHPSKNTSWQFSLLPK